MSLAQIISVGNVKKNKQKHIASSDSACLQVPPLRKLIQEEWKGEAILGNLVEAWIGDGDSAPAHTGR